MEVTKENLDQIFRYHPPNGSQVERYQALRDGAKAYARLILDTCPPSRERAVALTNLQLTNMAANLSIAVNEADPIDLSQVPHQ